MAQKNSIQYAENLDQQDPLAHYREKFYIPQINGEDSVYFTGNSLGLQPKSVKDYLQQELDDWAKYGVEGHFDAKKPWFAYHEFLTPKIAKIVGALDSEVVVTHSLTTNLHLLMVSFYRPTKERFKIICEAKAFPSDQYALESQVKFHGFDPKDAIVEIAPREGEHTINEEDIYKAIEENADSVALVMFGGVNYYTGQLFDLEKITAAGHKAGAVVGFDLAHAAGNVILKLHDWGVDFAAWCSYKYLNSSPGGVSGMFVHQKHEYKPELPRFAGWWGYDKDTRFLMEPGFVPMKGAEGWQLSNAPILGMAAHLASLDIFDEVGMEKLRAKSDQLTAYLEEIIDDISARKGHLCEFEIITPRNQKERGAQLSILAHGKGKAMFDSLTKQGVIADWREPNVIRIAPVPLYNSFVDIYKFGERLEKAIEE
ncbi:kynureninase [Paracrocinitomix mangrovi]|nr:kynureninase [Paracrocinitomix mangrovi]UKN03862.1 kynureninase [Paracrocinitomix mangrovi]